MTFENGSRTTQPWIHSASFDLVWIIGPSLFVSLIATLLSENFSNHALVGPIAWILLVVCIDVAHVYTSLFRTYLDPNLEQKYLLWLVPIFCWLVGAILFSMDPAYFWTTLAYTAVLHFVRQQYGFMMIYSRKDRSASRFDRELNRAMIYAATLYPLIFWHTHLPRNFSWLIEDDFIIAPWPFLNSLATMIYLEIIGLYVIKEFHLLRKSQFREINFPRNLLVFGTAASWYIGIVLFNNDLVFTLTNVVAHGIPYIALIWLYGCEKRREGSDAKVFQFLFRTRMLPVFVSLLFFLAYSEEALWDGFIWRDHQGLFPWTASLPVLHDRVLLALTVPLLALPQSTHYVFDAFLWRSHGKDSNWKSFLPESKDFR